MEEYLANMKTLRCYMNGSSSSCATRSPVPPPTASRSDFSVAAAAGGDGCAAGLQIWKRRQRSGRRTSSGSARPSMPTTATLP
jgi:hypothetical protein